MSANGICDVSVYYAYSILPENVAKIKEKEEITHAEKLGTFRQVFLLYFLTFLEDRINKNNMLHQNNYDNYDLKHARSILE